MSMNPLEQALLVDLRYRVEKLEANAAARELQKPTQTVIAVRFCEPVASIECWHRVPLWETLPPAWAVNFLQSKFKVYPPALDFWLVKLPWPSDVVMITQEEFDRNFKLVNA